MRARRRWETRTGAAEAQPAGVYSPANCLFSAKNSAAVFCDSRLFFAAPPPPPPSPASLFGGIPSDKGARIPGSAPGSHSQDFNTLHPILRPDPHAFVVSPCSRSLKRLRECPRLM